MINSIKHKGLRRYWKNDSSGALNKDWIERIQLYLELLEDTKEAENMNRTGFGLHELKGKRKGTYSLWVTGNWRLTFKIDDDGVYDVDLEDYH